MSTIGLTDDQRALRRLGIGASDVPAIVGLSDYRGALTVYREKVDGWQQPDSDAFEFGHRFEPVARQWFTDRTGLSVLSARSAVHPDEPWAMATLDGEVAEIQSFNFNAVVGVLEIKSFNIIEDGALKPDVLAQVLWQLHVTGLPHAWVTGLVGHGFQIREVDIADHADDMAWLVREAGKFWFDHVVPGIPPEPTGADLAMLSGIPATEGKTVAIGADVADLWQHRQSLKATITAAQDDLDGIDARIRDAIGDAEVATYAGVPILTARQTTRTGLDADAVRAVFPELAACRALHTTTTYRTLRQPPKGKKR